MFITVMYKTMNGFNTVYICFSENLKMKTVLFFLLSFISLVVFGQDFSQQRKSQFNLENGIAVGGYDPVSYFKQGKPVKGKKDLAVYAQGVTYHFASAENKEEFKNNPGNYEPQYGG